MMAVSDHLCRRVVGVRDVTGGGVPIIGVSVGAVAAAIPGGVEVTALATQKGGVVWAGWARAQWMDARGGAIGAELFTWSTDIQLAAWIDDVVTARVSTHVVMHSGTGDRVVLGGGRHEGGRPITPVWHIHAAGLRPRGGIRGEGWGGGGAGGRGVGSDG